MRRRNPLIISLVVTLAVLGASVTPARADTVLDLTVTEMAQMADAVIRGRVLSVDAAWNDSHTRIFTEVEIEVEAYLVGSGPDRVIIRQVGGTVGDTTLRVSGQPRFTPGQRVVAFLEPDGSGADNRWVVLCMAAGLYEVDFDELTGELVVTRNTRGLSRIPGPGRTSLIRARAARPNLLRELVAEIARARGQGAQR